jgi:hypothetical protein
VVGGLPGLQPWEAAGSCLKLARAGWQPSHLEWTALQVGILALCGEGEGAILVSVCGSILVKLISAFH